MDFTGRDPLNPSGLQVPALGFYGQPGAPAAGLMTTIQGYSLYHINGRVFGKPIAAAQLVPSAMPYPVPVAWPPGGTVPVMFMNQYQALPYQACLPQGLPDAYPGNRPHTSRRMPPRPLASQPAQPQPQALPQAQPAAAGPSAASGTSQPAAEPAPAEEDLLGGGWGWLLEGVLQLVLDGLPETDFKNFRQVCRHWREVADQNLEKLSPSCLKSKTILVRFPRLRVLQLINCPNVRNRDLFILSQGLLPLEVLTIGDESNKPWVTNRGLSSIAQISTIKRLSLHDCNSVTNKGLTCLTQMTQLKFLSLKGCKKITNNGLDVLEHLTALTSINLVGCTRISDKALLPLLPLKLEAIHLGNPRIHDGGMSYVAQLTTLKELQCITQDMTDTGLRELTTLTRLERLALQDCGAANGTGLLTLLSHLPHLTHLDLLHNYDFGDEQLAACLPHLSGLRVLDLRDTWVTEKGISRLQVLSHLHTLSLATNLETYSDALCAVSVLTRLTNLTVNGCSYISTNLLRALRCLPDLRSLDLSEESISDNLQYHPKELVSEVVVGQLAQLSTLTSLDLSQRHIRQDQLDIIASSLRRLLTLTIRDCPIPAASAVELQKKHSHLTIIRKDSMQDGLDGRLVVTK